MTHKPNHQEDGCTKCIINRFMMAILIRLFLDAIGKHALKKDASFLGRHLTAFNDLTAYAISLGLLDEPDPSEWNGCDRATEIMTWVDAIEKGPDITAADLIALTEAGPKMREWGQEYKAATRALVAGKTEGD